MLLDMNSLQRLTNSVLGPFFGFWEQFAWIGHATHVIKTPGLDQQLMPVAAGLGMSLPIIKVTNPMY
jgi:hypothetical protein